MRILFLLSLLLASSLNLGAEEHKASHRGFIITNADQIKSWYDQGVAMVVIDARSKDYFDGVLLPNAKWIPSNASDEIIQTSIPVKESMIVVYCSNSHCPAGGWLADRLIALGYSKVYEYPEGIKDWIEKGYPTSKL